MTLGKRTVQKAGDVTHFNTWLYPFSHEMSVAIVGSFSYSDRSKDGKKVLGRCFHNEQTTILHQHYNMEVNFNLIKKEKR